MLPSGRWFCRNLPIAGLLSLTWLLYRIATTRIPHWQDYVALITVAVVLANAWVTPAKLAEVEDEIARSKRAARE